MTTRFRFNGSLYSTVLIAMLAACGSSDESESGSGGATGSSCAGKTACFDLCMCKAGAVATTCLNQCNPGGANCGNGTLDPGELCDGPNLGGRNCDTATAGAQPTGVLSCTTSCTFNTSQCGGGSSSGGTGGFGGGGGVGGSTGGKGGGGGVSGAFGGGGP